MAKLSLTRILSELKLVDKKIEQLLEKDYVATYQKRNPVLNLKTKESFEKEAVENLQSLKDLFIRKSNLRNALSRANADTKINFNGKSYSINELLTIKNELIPLKINALHSLMNEINRTKAAYEKQNSIIEEKVEQMLMQGLSKDRKASGDEYEKIAKPFIEDNKILLSDAANISQYINELNKEITEFTSDIDILLSEINSKTEVEV